MDLSTSSATGGGGAEHSLSFADFGGLHLSSFMPHVAPDPSRSPPPSLRIAMRIPDGTRVHSNVPFSVSDAPAERDQGRASLSVLNPTPLPPHAVPWMPPPLSPMPFSPIHSPMPARAAAPAARAALREPSPAAALSSSLSSSLSGPSDAAALDAPISSSSGGSATSSSSSLHPLPLLSSSASLPLTAASSSPSPVVDAPPAAVAATSADSTSRPAPAAAASSAALSSSSSSLPLSDPDSSLVEVLSRLEQSQSEFNLALRSQTERRLREEARTDEGRELQATQRLSEQHSKESLSNILRAQATSRITERPWVAALRGEEISVHHYGVNPVDDKPIYPSTIVESEEKARKARSETREREEKQAATAREATSASSASAALSGSGRGLNALFVPSFVRAPAAPSNPRTLTVLERFGTLDPSASAASAATAAPTPLVSSFSSGPTMPLSSVSSSWPRGALHSSAAAMAPAPVTAPFASFSSAVSSFVPAAFASPSPSQEVADLFRLSHQRRDRTAPRSRIIDEQVGLRVGGGGVVRDAAAAEAPIAASGLHDLWSRQGAAKLAASLRQIEEMPSLAQVIANPVAVAVQQQQQQSSQVHSNQQQQPQTQSLPASISTALSLATGSVVPTSTPQIERQYEELKREYQQELRARKQLDEEAARAGLQREQEWREREEEEYQKVLQRTREERGMTQPVQHSQQQQQTPQSASNEPPTRQQSASAARSASASPVPSVRSLRPATLSRAASTSSNAARSQQPQQQTSLDSPHVAFSDSTAGPAPDVTDSASLESIEAHLEQLQCSTKEAASTPVTVFVQQALDAIESKLTTAPPHASQDVPERQRVAKELQELENLLQSTTATTQLKAASVKATPVGSSRSLPVSRRSSLHHSQAAGAGAGAPASSRALSSRALSSAVPSMRSSLQSSAQSSRTPSVHGEEDDQQEQAQHAAEPLPMRQLKPKPRASQQQQQHQQQNQQHQQQQAPLQTVSESSFSSRSSLPAGSSISGVHREDASSRSSFAPPTHARLASIASSSRGASILGESQLVHPPHSRHSSLAHASAIEEMMDRTLPFDEQQPQQLEQLHEEDQRSEHAGSQHHSEHLSVSRAASEHSSHTAPSTLKKPQQPRVRATTTGRLPLTAREVRALVRSEVLGSAAELRANYSYLPPPPRPITLTRTQMLQQAAREAATRRAEEQSVHGTQCRLARRAAPIAAAVRRNVEAMLEQQMKLRGAQWDRETQQQDSNGEGSQQPQHKGREQESKEESVPHRSPAQRAASAEVDAMLRDPPRILQPTFSPPAAGKHREAMSHSPARNYQSVAAMCSSPSQPHRSSSSSQPKSVLLSAVPQDYDVQSHLAGLFSTAQQQLQPQLQPQPPRDSSERSSRRGSASDPAVPAGVTAAVSANLPGSAPIGPSLSDLAAESSSSFVSSVTSSVVDEDSHNDEDEEEEEEDSESDSEQQREAAPQLQSSSNGHRADFVAQATAIMQQLSSAPMVLSSPHSRHSSSASSHDDAPRIELRPVAVVISPAASRR